MFPNGDSHWRILRNDEIGHRPHRLRDIRLNTLRIAGGPTKLKPDIPAFNPSEFGQAITKNRNPALRCQVLFRNCEQDNDASHRLRVPRCREA